MPKSREHRPSSLLISVLFQWLTTSSRPLTEQGETWGPAGWNRENLEPLQGEPMLRSSRGAFDSPRDQRRRGVAHELNRWSGATTFFMNRFFLLTLSAPLSNPAQFERQLIGVVYRRSASALRCARVGGRSARPQRHAAFAENTSNRTSMLTRRHLVVRSASAITSAQRSRSVGPKPLVVALGPYCAGATVDIQVYPHDGRPTT